MAQTFSYHHAFARNLGWVTPAEQSLLKEKRIAIAGLGGVGGFHLLTLARLGVGAFHIADFDTFDIANFNRQTAAPLGMGTAVLNFMPGQMTFEQYFGWGDLPDDEILAAPRSYQYDGYRNKLVRTWRPGGHRHPLQWLAMMLAKRRRPGDES